MIAFWFLVGVCTLAGVGVLAFWWGAALGRATGYADGYRDGGRADVWPRNHVDQIRLGSGYDGDGF